MHGLNPSKLVGLFQTEKRRTALKLSTKGRYGLRALIDLAVHDGEDAVSIQSIADRQGISESYLEQLVRLLKKAGLVISVRGAGGGYRLAKRPDQISVGDTLRALEGNLEAVTCSAFGEQPTCQGADVCVTKLVWKKINDAITNTVDGIMLDELVEESRQIIEKQGIRKTPVC